MSAERRLDDAAAMLGRARPRLDDLTRARVGARLEEALADGDAAPPARSGRRTMVALAAAGCAAAAAALVVVAGRGPGREGADQRAEAVAPDAAVEGVTPPPAPPAPPAPPPIDRPRRVEVAARDSRRLELGDTMVTVVGPGSFEGDEAGGRADTVALVVDRARGDVPWTLRRGPVEIVATRATFSVDRGAAVRVTVMRGEVILRCDGGERRVGAGRSGDCAEPAPARRPPPIAPAPGARGDAPPAGPPPAEAPATEPAPPPAPPVEPVEQALPPEPVPTSAVPDLYALAEGAMRRGDHAGARAALQAVVAAGPGSLEAAMALVDLARLAHADGDDAAARGYLDRLERHPHRAAVAAPVARLRAQVAPE